MEISSKILRRLYRGYSMGRCRREVLGRPSLASTLPLDITMDHIGTPENMLENQTQAGNPHSISMVALPHDSLTPECRLRTIGEVDTPDKAQPPIGNGFTTCETATVEHAVGLNLVDASVQQSTGSVGRSQISTLQSVVSEPLNNSNQTGRLYTLGAQQSTTECDSMRLKSLGSSEVALRQVHPDQLVVYFKDMPRRRYAPEAIIKQRKLVKCQASLNTGAHMHSDIFDTDDEESELTPESALAALQSAAEAGQAWAAEGDESEIKEIEQPPGTAPLLSFSRLFNNSSASSSSPNHEPDRLQTHTTAVDVQAPSTGHSNTSEDNDAVVPVSGWRLMALSAAFLTGASLVGLTVLLETEIHSPLTAAIRSHPWLLEFDARYYRPLRSAFFSLWRR
ncbi:unnamed protein product [Echinostoma caproni]|uniref:Transmembrane protein n=1 Tax=Echinostoma caproni TaxID=27848 RepID=A0A183ACL1_9TREM|nr:unnamed protein product [Echinostoma caproni]